MNWQFGRFWSLWPLFLFVSGQDRLCLTSDNQLKKGDYENPHREPTFDILFLKILSLRQRRFSTIY